MSNKLKEKCKTCNKIVPLHTSIEYTNLIRHRYCCLKSDKTRKLTEKQILDMNDDTHNKMAKRCRGCEKITNGNLYHHINNCHKKYEVKDGKKTRTWSIHDKFDARSKRAINWKKM
ncbi:PREDICTED: uncharacterized protein LOC105559716 [Vollenhovia emeryi]|uniref:uncharacterized protein LOC105559716 n=1 Tax=Vollenhovia emeryi TaxID=411798 RepID=UPI0005F3AA8A|nr:PREDICTED: uncharacterized protein LOC105559716 [Vollenhovia emeryi]